MFRVMLVSLLFAVVAGSRLDNRLLGSAANIREFPYQVSVHYQGQHVCGGALISRSKVITSASCVHGYQEKLLSISHSHSEYANGIFESVASVVCHPSYVYPKINNDVCVLTLGRVIPEQYIANPILLVAAGTPDGTRAGTVAGWGVFSTLGSIPSPTLKSTSVHEVNRNNCTGEWPNVITDQMLCFVASTPLGPCKYDTGSPIVVNGKLVGLVSLPVTCMSDTDTKPSIYSNIAQLRDFIDLHLN